MAPGRRRDPADPTRTILVALAGNLVIAAAKFAGAAATGSGAMAAEGFHSLADAGNEILLLWGRRQAAAPPTPEHPLGHGRNSYFWSFMVALLLFSAGGVASIVEGLHKLDAHDTLHSPGIAIAILIVAAICEGTSELIALRQIRRLRGRRSLWRWLRETRRSELIVVFAEDAAALLGIAIALAAIIASAVTGETFWDALGSIAIGVLLVVVAVLLAVEIKSLLIGESAGPTVREALERFLAARAEIAGIEQLITTQEGEYVAIAIRARMRETVSAPALLRDVAACKRALGCEFPQVRWVFFEPADATNVEDRGVDCG